jgi:hypothetical protein
MGKKSEFILLFCNRFLAFVEGSRGKIIHVNNKILDPVGKKLIDKSHK